MTQNELNYIREALAFKNEELIRDIVESDTFKKKALAEAREKNETKKTKKEKSE